MKNGPLLVVAIGVFRSFSRIRAVGGRPSAALVAVAAILLGGAAHMPEVSAATNYVIKEPIHQHLERTADEHGLCRLKGMSMNQMLLFMPESTGGTSVYWHRPTDRFVQYPGLSACSVWKRLGA